VVFIETPIFTQLVKAVLTDEAYGQFQRWLAANPDAGADLTPAQVKQLAKHAEALK
jgi:hypothetical protein